MLLAGSHYQNAYVTRDIDAAVARFKQHADIRKLMEFEVAVQLWTPQAEGTGVQKLAFVWVGDLQIELIQPVEGQVLALFRDALPADDRVAFHHICLRVEDWDAFTAEVDRHPFPIVLKGGTPGMLQFVYLDSREWLGHYTEFCWMVPDRWAAMGGR